MKHFAKINEEFVKCAIGAWWFKRTPQFRKVYLEENPTSKAPRSISRPSQLIVDVAKMRFQHIVNLGKDLKSAINNLCKYVSPFQNEILEKNLYDLQSQINADITNYINKTRSDFGRFGSKLVTQSRLTSKRDKNMSSWQLQVGKLFEDGSRRFNYITQHFTPKVNLHDGLVKTTGSLNLNDAVRVNSQELKSVIEKWLKTTKSIANADDYLEKLGKFDVRSL